jgi:hypothetical protein
MRFLFLSAIIALDLVIATPASSEQSLRDYLGEKSALLDSGMTEQQVTKTVGYRPSKVEMQTCGQQTKQGPWACKKHTYGLPLQNLTVFLHSHRRMGFGVQSVGAFILSRFV